MFATTYATIVSAAIHEAATDISHTPTILKASLPADRLKRLQWLLAWRREYAKLSNDIREAKRQRSQGNEENRSAAQYRCHVLKGVARGAMALRNAYTDAIRGERLQ